MEAEESDIAGSGSAGPAAGCWGPGKPAFCVPTGGPETAGVGATADGAVMGAPQKTQNRMPAGTDLPHAGQRASGAGATRAPHCVQNWEPEGSGEPQDEQNMAK